MVKIEVDTGDMHEFFNKCTKAGDDLKKEFELFLEGIGFDFLRVIQDFLTDGKHNVTSLLVSSFNKGDDNNVWEYDKGNIILEVGTNVEYAKFANDGHWQDRRFVPGDVVTDSNGKVIEFEYNKNANTGIMLAAKKVEGIKYWEYGLDYIEKHLPKFLEEKMEQLLLKYFE